MSFKNMHFAAKLTKFYITYNGEILELVHTPDLVRFLYDLALGGKGNVIGKSRSHTIRLLQV